MERKKIGRNLFPYEMLLDYAQVMADINMTLALKVFAAKVSIQESHGNHTDAYAAVVDTYDDGTVDVLPVPATYQL